MSSCPLPQHSSSALAMRLVCLASVVCVCLNSHAADLYAKRKLAPKQATTQQMDANDMMERARTSLLAELKQATRYRVAHRTQYPDLERQMYGFEPRLLNFNEPRLHSICEGVAKALFKEQSRITPMPRPTAWVKRDGEAKVRQVLQGTFPKCSSDTGFMDSAYAGKPAADRLRNLELESESRVYLTEGGVFFVDQNTARVQGPNGTKEERHRFARLYLGEKTCPVGGTGAGVGTEVGAEPTPFDPSTGALMRVDGRVALVEKSRVDTYVLGYELNKLRQRGEDYNEEEERNDPQRLQARFHSYPTDQPSPEDKMLEVYIPPFSPLMPPIAPNDNAWAPTDQPDGAPERSSSFSPSCFIYFQ